MKKSMLLLTAVSAAAFAQPALEGDWDARYSGQGGGAREALLRVKDGNASWLVHAKSNKDRRDACIGQAWPAKLQPSPDGAISLSADGSKLASFCGRIEVLLKPQPDGSWEGELHGAPIRLRRKD